ncbi:MAG: NUDIX domain-containing protein [Haliscomenobacteraceae bacterium CHB4]|nr:RNA pyrophosphohydrolase [Saprospiraceae bacterium]MCE7925656.1 NUDIX domain-containing protein [Haliscomenobacteraceae bacterium CHB4]
MAQNYKIYHNSVPVFLTTPEEAAELGLKPDKTTFVAPYSGKKKMLKQYLDLLDKNRSVRAVVLFHADLALLWADFQACFKVIGAAGGFVQNAQNELLVFFRRGSWDLPKGKIDPGETPEQAAVREVQEETGLVNLVLGEFLAHTYHTYEMKDERILKKTWWYRMKTTDNRLIPQTEEDIEKICWVEPKAWLASDPVVYPNIRAVIEAGVSEGV